MTTLRLHVVEVVHVVHVVYVVHVVHVQHYSSLSDSTFSPYASSPGGGEIVEFRCLEAS